jgi:hypothetical protein
MKLRPQFQLRLRDEAQFHQVKALADVAGLSVNEWLVRQIERGVMPNDDRRTIRTPEMPAVSRRAVKAEQKTACPSCGSIGQHQKWCKA